MREIRRLVFLFAGFEPHAAEEQRARFAYAADKTGLLWDSSFDVGALRSGGHGCAEFHVTAHGQGWKAESYVMVCDWSDLLRKVQNQNTFRRFLSGYWALACFTLNGTLLRYAAASWRYGLFFLFPGILTFAALAPLSLAFAGGAPAAVGVLLSVCLMWLFSKRLHLLVMLDNWSFAHALALERNADILAKAELFKSAMRKRIEDFHLQGGGEVLVAAHSLGACFAASALGGVLSERLNQPAPGLLMAGSSLLKIALHPKATQLRTAASEIARSDAHWLEVQSLTDLLNFFRADPMATLGIPAKRQPVLQFVRFRSLLTPETYRRIKFNWLRVHRQYVLAAERRTNYSWHMMLAGPFRFAEIMEHRGLPEEFAATAQFKDMPE